MILSTTDFEKSFSLDMDKITIIKMLLASQDENRQLQVRFDNGTFSKPYDKTKFYRQPYRES
jgi:hypothetical protein